MAAVGDRIGERIGSTVDALRQRGIKVEHRTHADDTVYTLAGSTYHIVVTVNPVRWVGLHFGLGKPDQKPTLTYDIDTDLYDLAHPRFASLARAVEDDIVAFLDSLGAGRIRVGKVGRQTALLVPAGNRTMIITRGRFARSVRIRRAPSSIESKSKFTPLT